MTLVPDAREGGGSFGRIGGRRERVTGGKSDPVRSAVEAARRARRMSRRYAVANGLNRFGTLTYDGAGCHDPRQVKRDVGQFFRRLRRLRGRGAFPYLWAAEWHKTDHGLHAHYLVGDFVNRDLINEAWGWGTIPGRGFTWIKLISDLPVGSTRSDEARIAARYIAKYVGKDYDASLFPKGWHRYEVAEDFQPDEVRLFGETESEVIAKASAIMGCRPNEYWSSRQDPDWDRPQAMWCQWPG